MRKTSLFEHARQCCAWDFMNAEGDRILKNVSLSEAGSLAESSKRNRLRQWDVSFGHSLIVSLVEVYFGGRSPTACGLVFFLSVSVVGEWYCFNDLGYSLIRNNLVEEKKALRIHSHDFQWISRGRRDRRRRRRRRKKNVKIYQENFLKLKIKQISRIERYNKYIWWVLCMSKCFPNVCGCICASSKTLQTEREREKSAKKYTHIPFLLNEWTMLRRQFIFCRFSKNISTLWKKTILKNFLKNFFSL